MKFARGLAVFSVISASLPLAIACGSASNDLFSPSGGGSSIAGAGAASSSAGAASVAGAENGAAAGAETSMAGLSSSGADNGGGSSGAATGGMSGNAAGGAHTAGSGGASAGSAGASAGSGGASAGAANAGGGGTSGAAGASAGMGGSAGSAGSAGMAGAPACPVAGAPQDGASCSVSTPDSCFYAGQACSCLQQGGNQNQHQWGCYGTPNKCPDSKPVAGLSCKANNLGAACPYPGNDFCACVVMGNEAHWVCQPAQPICSQTKPNQGAVCTTVRTCSYGDVACFCNGDNWGCEGG